MRRNRKTDDGYLGKIQYHLTRYWEACQDGDVYGMDEALSKVEYFNLRRTCVLMPKRAERIALRENRKVMNNGEISAK